MFGDRRLGHARARLVTAAMGAVCDLAIIVSTG